MKSSLQLYTAALALCVAFTGCKKFLDVVPPSEITSANFYSSANDAEAGLVGCYDAMQPDSYYGFDMSGYGDVTSDDCDAGGDSQARQNMDDFTTNSTNGTISRNWSQIYNAIGRTNDVITNLGRMDDNLFQNGRKNVILGEARMLRGLHYFNLVRIFGGVPLVTEQVTDSRPETVNKPRSTPAEIYAQVISDLQFAAANLPADATNGRATKGAALGLLAKVYLTQKNWQQAADYAGQVITPGKYQLDANYDDLFAQDNTPEIIFSVQYVGQAEGNVLPDLLLPFPQASYEFIKFNVPTQSIMNAYETGDVRKASSIIVTNQSYGQNIPFVNKYRRAAAFASPADITILRYADVLLMRAEALNELGGGNAEALSLLNQVRTRAKLPVKTAAELGTQAAFRDFVAKERRVELAFEGERWFDLLRTGKAIATLQAAGKPITEKFLLFPLPQDELDRNPNLVQNPGY
ncbi:MAG: RagB/SusD family nutrient uptake outer membrane protein [Mucilaginibacter polytrichastri]|nr:RagB/SusD family nutrient uptake outer membrane protein [Mucilaginibacter polytrichastri]